MKRIKIIITVFFLSIIKLTAQDTLPPHLDSLDIYYSYIYEEHPGADPGYFLDVEFRAYNFNIGDTFQLFVKNIKQDTICVNETYILTKKSYNQTADIKYIDSDSINYYDNVWLGDQFLGDAELRDLYIRITYKDSLGNMLDMLEYNEKLTSQFFFNRNDNKNFKIFPNPFKDAVYVKILNKNIRVDNVAIYNQNGRKVAFNEKVDVQDLITFNTSNIQSGYYVCKITTNNTVHTKKILK